MCKGGTSHVICSFCEEIVNLQVYQFQDVNKRYLFHLKKTDVIIEHLEKASVSLQEEVKIGAIVNWCTEDQ